MLAEMIRAIAEMAKKEDAVKILPIPGDHKNQLIVNGAGYEKVPVSEPDRNHKADTLDSFIECGERWQFSTVWVNVSGCYGKLDDNHRRDTVTLKLHPTDKWDALGRLADMQVTANGLIDFIKRNLRNTGAESLIATMAKVEWASSQTGASTKGHGAESMGKSVEASVNAIDEIPDTIELRMQRFLGIPHQVSVMCHIGIDHQRQCFQVIPLADELENATKEALEKIQADLKGSFDAVYLGGD